MIEILGGLLGQKAGGSGTGADILRDILGGGQQQQRREAPTPAGQSRSPKPPTENEIERQASDLEDLLNIAKNRKLGSAAPQSQPSQPASFPQQPAGRAPSTGTLGQGTSAGRRLDAPQDDAAARQNEQAKILVRAMVQAAKCDGQISQAEQQSILNQIENPSPEAIQFLREEFAKPFDAREFAWSVPVGMEQQVYTLSLIAIDVDSEREQRYLGELAHGLRLSPEVCDQIKERLLGTRVHYAAGR
jgi:hypothetical protein